MMLLVELNVGGSEKKEFQVNFILREPQNFMLVVRLASSIPSPLYFDQL